MTSAAVLLLFLLLGFAALSVLAHGWTLTGVGPALLVTAGGFWQLWMQWLRHRSWLRYKDSDFAPDTAIGDRGDCGLGIAHADRRDLGWCSF
jgi:hypothetical protein